MLSPIPFAALPSPAAPTSEIPGNIFSLLEIIGFRRLLDFAGGFVFCIVVGEYPVRRRFDENPPIPPVIAQTDFRIGRFVHPFSPATLTRIPSVRLSFQHPILIIAHSRVYGAPRAGYVQLHIIAVFHRRIFGFYQIPPRFRGTPAPYNLT